MEQIVTVGRRKRSTARVFLQKGSGEITVNKKKLEVYGRGKQECFNCKKELKEIRLGNRSTVYCTNCQN